MNEKITPLQVCISIFFNVFIHKYSKSIYHINTIYNWSMKGENKELYDENLKKVSNFNFSMYSISSALQI